MLFSQKSQGYFLDFAEHAVFGARTSSMEAPFVVEVMRECPAGDPGALAAMLAQLQPKKSPTGYLHATVGLYPPKRVVRRHTVEPKRLREPGYFAEICTQQFRIEQEAYALFMVNAADGSDLEAVKTPTKEVVVCGMANEDATAAQTTLLEAGVYPERIELGSVATLGAVVSCLGQARSKSPVLVLEIEADAMHSFIVTAGGVEASRPIPQGLNAMIPIVQKELGLKDEESARRLFFSNTFDFTGMGPQLVKKLLKELQSSIGFYEVQTGQSVSEVLTTQLSPKLQWLEAAIASALGIKPLKLEQAAWLESRGITLREDAGANLADPRWLGLFALMANYNASDALVAEEKK
ncbi:MAG: hypothetical protein Q8N18_23485 [Opitutaceae bacterium]|nr:hypothetical protein [Opitutaceae bacterium]